MVNWNLEFLGIPRLKNNDCEFPGILRNSKLKENQTEKSKTFQEIPNNFLELLGKLGTNNGCVYIFLAFEVQTNNIKWGHNHQSE